MLCRVVPGCGRGSPRATGVQRLTTVPSRGKIKQKPYSSDPLVQLYQRVRRRHPRAVDMLPYLTLPTLPYLTFKLLVRGRVLRRRVELDLDARARVGAGVVERADVEHVGGPDVLDHGSRAVRACPSTSTSHTIMVSIARGYGACVRVASLALEIWTCAMCINRQAARCNAPCHSGVAAGGCENKCV